MTMHLVDRISVCVDWDNRRAYGWSKLVKEGDKIAIPMQSGKMSIFRLKNFRRMSDPRDQYFADLEEVVEDTPKERDEIILIILASCFVLFSCLFILGAI